MLWEWYRHFIRCLIGMQNKFTIRKVKKLVLSQSLLDILFGNYFSFTHTHTYTHTQTHTHTYTHKHTHLHSHTHTRARAHTHPSSLPPKTSKRLKGEHIPVVLTGAVNMVLLRCVFTVSRRVIPQLRTSSIGCVARTALPCLKTFVWQNFSSRWVFLTLEFCFQTVPLFQHAMIKIIPTALRLIFQVMVLPL